MTESIVPIYEPNRGWRSWHIREIYQGPDSPGRYVPNVDDLVVDWNSGFYRVGGVDLSTGLSRLEPWTGLNDTTGVEQENVLLGTDVGAQGESFRVYLDRSVTPHTLAVDSRLRLYGSGASSIKVFKGTNLSDQGNVISAMYDNNGVFLGENIPLELVGAPDPTNLAIKTPMVGYTLSQLDDGEVVTAVVYDDLGYVVSYCKLLVKNTAFIRTTEANRKYVAGIHLESAFLSKTDDRVLEFPTNLPVKDVPVTGVVTYSDGSQVKYPANGGRFKLYGLDHFVSTIVGQKVPLVLSYRLDDDEMCYGASPGHNKHLSEKYWGTTSEFEKAYSVKLYAYPRWIDDIRGYVLDFYLYTLDRAHVHHVTPHVSLAGESASFHPMDYGVKQKLTFSVDMNKVDSRYPTYRHVQTMEVTLLSPGTDTTDNWQVGFSPNQRPSYGKGLSAKVTYLNANKWSLDVSCGLHSQEEWLKHVYYATEPLVHYTLEDLAPPPNVFVVKMKDREYEFGIGDWNKSLDVINDLAQGENLIIEFIHRIYENDLQLGIAALPVHNASY